MGLPIEKLKVSIIVPVYNVEKYLERCLKSLLNQSLKDIEIIAINDGSTDSSQIILENFKKIDKRIKVINQQNGGVSSARNVGISLALGEYIGFVDPDDWVDPVMYQKLYQISCEEQSDIVMCSYQREYGNHSKEKKYPLPQKVYYSNEEVKQEILRRLIGPINNEVSNPELLDAWGTVWSKLYKSELIKNNHLEFVDLNKIGTNEDTLFNIQAVYFCRGFTFINKSLYHYWKGNSTSITTKYKPNLINQFIKQYQMLESFIKSNSLGETYQQALRNRICLNTLGLGLNVISKNNKSSIIEKIKQIKGILQNQNFKYAFDELDMSQFPVIWRVFFTCAKRQYSFGFYFLLISVEILRKLK